jgi:hypothetical protein
LATVEPVIAASTQKQAMLDAVTTRINELGLNEGEVAHEIGRLILRVRAEGLHLEKYESIKEYIDDRLVVSRTVAFKYARVAERYTAEMVRSVGCEKLDAIIAFARVTRAPNVIDPFESDLDVIAPDGTTIKKRFADATLREIQTASRAARMEKRATEAAGLTAEEAFNALLCDVNLRLRDAGLETVEITSDWVDGRGLVMASDLDASNMERVFTIMANAAKRHRRLAPAN